MSTIEEQLVQAAKKGSVIEVKSLIAQGADINCGNKLKLKRHRMNDNNVKLL